MCELLAYSAREPQQVNSILDAFYKRSPYHPHGWGLGLFDENVSIIQKEPIRAIDSRFLKRQLKRPLKYKSVLGHIRLATVGYKTKENSHPFNGIDITGREWVLIHNGTLFDDSRVSAYESVQKGDTDSERILLFLIDRMNKAIKDKGSDLEPQERFEIVNQLVLDLAEENKLNLMIYDGEQFYIHANSVEQMFYTTVHGGTLISTTPLEIKGHDNLIWTPIPTKQTHCYKNGELLYSAEPHEYQYILDPEVEKLLYLKYAAL